MVFKGKLKTRARSLEEKQMVLMFVQFHSKRIDYGSFVENGEKYFPHKFNVIIGRTSDRENTMVQLAGDRSNPAVRESEKMCALAMPTITKLRRSAP